jgi:hypothetical protein
MKPLFVRVSLVSFEALKALDGPTRKVWQPTPGDFHSLHYLVVRSQPWRLFTS